MLLGPTASGKTAALERAYDGSFEVVVADSMQAYRGLDIGTAKPSRETLGRIPHHLVDILDPSQQYTCGDFVRHAEHAVQMIIERGNVPLVSGGTAYYMRSLLFGLPASPVGEPAVRASLEAEEHARGLASLYRELCRADPAAASSIHPNDRYRIVRALEILRVTGRPRSEIAVPGSLRGDWRFLVIGLALPRADLQRRIAARVAGMFEQGLLREVQGLLRSGCTERDPGMRGIGYREFFTMRRGCLTLDSLAALISGNTLRFAKRQMTFFRVIPGTVWVHPDRADEIAALIRSARSGQVRPGSGP